MLEIFALRVFIAAAKSFQEQHAACASSRNDREFPPPGYEGLLEQFENDCMPVKMINFYAIGSIHIEL